MKRAFVMLTAVVVLAGVTGCRCPNMQGLTSLIFGSCRAAPENCASCDDTSCAGCDDASCAGCDDASCGDCSDCGNCDDLRCRLCSRRGREAVAPGPPTGAITYPYYTTRGPRDFLAKDPRSIGP